MSRQWQLDFAARNRARNAEYQARRDQERQFQQQQILAQQQADAAQQQAILQANLSAMQAGGMAYQQDQMRRQAEQRFAAGSTGRKNDARAAAVFQDNLRRDAGREQARIASGAMDQQAGIQSQRDAALHGYGQSDARLAQRFNQANAIQQHGFNLDAGRVAQGYTMDRDAALHGYGQADASQQHGYNLESGRIAQGYNQDNERLRHGFQTDLQQRGFDLDQRGADAQQMRGQEDARFSNQMQRGNSYDQMTQEKLNQGWTYRPEDKVELDKLRKEQNSLPGKVRSHVITSKEAARQYELLEDEMRYFQPDVPPPRVDPEQEFNQGTYERGGVLYNKNGDKGWSVLHDPSLAQQGRGSSTQTGSYDPQTGRPVRAEANKLYSDLRKNWMDHKRQVEDAAYGVDGQRLANAPKAMTWEEFLRSENSQRPDDDIKLMYPELFQESVPAGAGAGTQPPANTSAKPVQDWQEMGAQLIRNSMQNQMKKANDAYQERADLDNEPAVTAAMSINPQAAAPIVQELKQKMARFVILAQEGGDPDVLEPELLDRMKELRQALKDLVGPNTNPYGHPTIPNRNPNILDWQRQMPVSNAATIPQYSNEF